MIWRCLGRLSALVVCGVVAGPVWAEPYLRVAQSAESPAAPSEPSAQSAPDTPSGDAPPQPEAVSPTPSPDAALPQASDAELETITVKPSRKVAAKAPAKRRTSPAPAGPADPQAPEEPAAEASRHRRGRIRLGPGRRLYRHAERDRNQDRNADPRNAARHLGGGPRANHGAGRSVGRGSADLYLWCARRGVRLQSSLRQLLHPRLRRVVLRRALPRRHEDVWRHAAGAVRRRTHRGAERSGLGAVRPGAAGRPRQHGAPSARSPRRIMPPISNMAASTACKAASMSVGRCRRNSTTA